MPGDSKTNGASPRRGNPKGRAPRTDPPADDGDATATADSATADPDPGDQPMNRAERRARGKSAQHQPAGQGHGKVAGAKGPGHPQRIWNRRTG
jgi:hypothetical protein